MEDYEVTVLEKNCRQKFMHTTATISPPNMNDADRRPILELVESIFTIVKKDSFHKIKTQSKVEEQRNLIDQKICELYRLPLDERAIAKEK